MSNFKSLVSSPAVRKAAFLIPALALVCVAGPAMAGTANGGTLFGQMFTTMNGMQNDMKTIIAVVGFIVALISLVALRSFTAVLFFLGLAVFGSAGLGVATTLIGAPLSLI